MTRQATPLEALQQITAPPAPHAFMHQQPTIVVHNVVTNTAIANGYGRRLWSPLVAAFLSFLIPGLGQIYRGHVLRGILWFFVVTAGYIAFVVPGLILHLACIICAAVGDPCRR